jgi:murein DD-endopeptidase MepM/ murein hydrolase activator NlpD
MSRRIRVVVLGLFLLPTLLLIGLKINQRVSIVSESSIVSTLESEKSLTIESTGMVKPVADLRDYNGTYKGTPGTGMIGYSTLYRDNGDQGALSGCNGEGCGSHPGVDIPVISGTRVYATLDGTVVRSECEPHRWGGLVVIKAINPYRSSESVYFIFAHLRQRLVSKGQLVNTGELIGYSGGSSADPCRGNSTGAHLHYQIDKDNGPYFTNNVNIPDSDFSVTTRTYNPIVFVVGGYKWSFEQPGFAELWMPFNANSSGVTEGCLQINGRKNIYIQRGGVNVNCDFTKLCQNSFAAESSLYTQITLKLSERCTKRPGKIYFTTSTDPNWDEAKSTIYPPSFYNETVHINMTRNSKWIGIITGVRIAPAVNYVTNSGDAIYFDGISIDR